MRARSAFFGALFAGAAIAAPSVGDSAVGFMQYFAVLDAGNELDGGHAGATGTAMVMLAPRAGALCFAIAVRDLDKPTAAHIHGGAAGVNGAILVTLVAPSTGNPGASSGCLTGVDTATIAAIKAAPNKFYINVHSTSNSLGALRGQLF
jgi:hypothetical protein